MPPLGDFPVQVLTFYIEHSSFFIILVIVITPQNIEKKNLL